MHFEPDNVYHVYNRGNGKQKIFFSRENYLYLLYLLKKVRAEWLPLAKPLAYCPMPNHFHFILIPQKAGCEFVALNGKETHLQTLSKAIGKTLSSYTLGINKQESRTGNLFQKKTKAKIICPVHPVYVFDPYLLACVHYVHFNPKAAGLVSCDADWEFSSARDYAGLRNGTLCDQELLFRISGMMPADFNHDSIDNEELMKRLYGDEKGKPATG